MATPPIPKSQKKGNLSRRKVLEQRRRLSKKSTDERYVGYMKIFYTHLLTDAYNMLDGLYSKADSTRDIKRINMRLNSEGVTFATKTLPSYIATVLQLLDNKDASFTGFKLSANRIPRFLGGVTSLVLESTDHVISSLAFESLYTICVAFKKLRGDYNEKKLIDKYLSFVKEDTRVPVVDFNNDPIALTARELAKRFVSNIDLSDDHFLPRPGPGATNTPTLKSQRYSPRILFRQVDNVLPYVEWFYTHYIRVVDHSSAYIALENQAVDRQTARFKFVPKTYEEARGICIEENEVQVIQQGIRSGIWHYISEDSVIGPCLPLNDQSVNAFLALQSSATGESATIDMSEASNMVFRIVVAWLFQDHADFTDVLMALSTRVIVPPKLVGLQALPFECNMYAPMGSGLCFPIMSLVHLFLVQAIMLNVAKCTSAELAGVRVYGDDIVIPSHCVQAIMEHLPKFGMKLNKTKSFWDGPFRESCGVHAIHGMNVTPVYVKHIPVVDDLTKVQSLLKNEADYYSKGFYQTAEFLRITLCDVYPKLQLGRHVARESCGFAGFFRQFSSPIVGKTRWNADLQCKQYRLPRFISGTGKAEITEEEAYLRWLWMHGKNSRVVDDSTIPVKIGWCWVPQSHTYTSSAFSDNLLKHAPVYCVDGLRW